MMLLSQVGQQHLQRQYLFQSDEYFCVKWTTTVQLSTCRQQTPLRHIHIKQLLYHGCVRLIMVIMLRVPIGTISTLLLQHVHSESMHQYPYEETQILRDNDLMRTVQVLHPQQLYCQ
jgi:hypothetical protein